MHAPKANDYREWDRDQLDSWWFTLRGGPDRETLAKVHPLSRDYAEQLWRWIFPTQEHFLLLVSKEKKGWLRDVFASEPIHWGRPGDPPLETHLMRHFPWPPEEQVIFLVQLGVGYVTE